MSRVRALAGAVRRNWRAIAAVVLALALVAVGAFVWYFSNPLHARDGELADATARDDVEISRAHGGYVVEPAETPPDEPRVGVVFYPGGRVHPDAYVPSLARIAAGANVTVFVPSVRLNLAVLDRNRAADVIGAHPEIDRWYVGGHSLGGAMACRYAKGDDEIEGLLLFAAYCDRDVSETDLAVLSVTGEADAVLDRGRYESTRSNLPDDAVFVDLAGVNHSQFGAYVGQRGGQPSGTTFETAHERLAGAVVPWLTNETATRPSSHRAPESRTAVRSPTPSARSVAFLTVDPQAGV